MRQFGEPEQERVDVGGKFRTGGGPIRITRLDYQAERSLVANCPRDTVPLTITLASPAEQLIPIGDIAGIGMYTTSDVPEQFNSTRAAGGG